MNMRFIDPGAFRTELDVEEMIPAPDGLGGHTETWETVATVFAQVEPLRAGMRFGADQTLETVTHRITMRFRETVRSGMRLRRDARYFGIVTVHDPDETRRYLVCSAREAGR